MFHWHRETSPINLVKFGNQAADCKECLTNIVAHIIGQELPNYVHNDLPEILQRIWK
jgi:hypothetical protein